jgi:hypothetical protein
MLPVRRAQVSHVPAAGDALGLLVVPVEHVIALGVDVEVVDRAYDEAAEHQEQKEFAEESQYIFQ